MGFVMESILILLFLAIVYPILLLRIFPGLLAPRCPLCGAHLECSVADEKNRLWHRWHIGWRRYSCVQCLYYHVRPFLFRTIDSPVATGAWSSDSRYGLETGSRRGFPR